MADLPKGFELIVEETTPEEVQDILPPSREALIPKGYEPIPEAEEGTLERTMIGVGRGLKNRSEGLTQRALEIKSLATDPTAPMTEVEAYEEQVRQERELYEQTPVGGTTASKVGEFIGEAAPDLAIPMGRGTSAGKRMLQAMSAGAVAGGTRFTETPQEAVTNTALAGILAGAGSLAIDIARPNALLISRKMRQAFKEPDILRTFNKSERVAKETGVDFTLGQATGSRTLLAFEEAAAQASPDRVLQFHNTRIRQGLKLVRSAIEKMGDPYANPSQVGNQLREGTEKTINRVVKVRTYLWDKNMEKASAIAGDSPVGYPKATSVKLNDIIEELSDPLAEYPASVVNGLKKIRSKATTNWTVRDYQKALKKWGAAAQGTGRPFKDLDTADSRRIFRELKNTVEKDIDDIIATGKGKGEALRHMQRARESWRLNSEKLKGIEDTVIGQLLNKGGKPVAPETFYKRVAGMEASEFKALAPLLDRADPSILNNTRALVIKDALEKAMVGANAPESLVKLSPSQFVANLKLTPTTMEMFKGVSRRELVKTIQAMRRLADSGSLARSAQSPIGAAAEVTGLGGGAFQGGAVGLPDPVFIGRFLAKNLSPDRYAKLLMTKEGRKAVMNIANQRKLPRKAVTSSVGTLVGIMTEDTIGME